jgi:hypothetical protein
VATIALQNVPKPGDTLWVGDMVRLIAEARDSAGTTVSDYPVVWHSTAPSVLSISADGLLHAVAVGTARVTATAGGKSARGGPLGYRGHDRQRCCSELRFVPPDWRYNPP